MLGAVSSSLTKARRVFTDVAPGIPSILKPKWMRALWRSKGLIRAGVKLHKGDIQLHDIVGAVTAEVVLNNIGKKRVQLRFRRELHQHVRDSKLGIYNNNIFRGDGVRELRSWPIAGDDNTSSGRVTRKMRLMYHESDVAPTHIDVHIGRTSFIVRVQGKEVENHIRFNANGRLTGESRELLLEHVRREISNHARMPQNVDHSISNGAISWLTRQQGERILSSNYGAGRTRQLITEDDVEIIHSRQGHMKLYAPILNKDNLIFVHELYPGVQSKAPIVVWGEYKPDIPKLHDKLHLRMIDGDDLPKFLSMVDKDTTTRKYDGAATYAVLSTKGGGTFWSPRISKSTNRRIEYTGKLPELARLRSDVNSVSMGELLFTPKSKLRRLGKLITTGNIYLSAAETGGILNSDKIRPLDIVPNIRLYRVDRYNGRNTHDLPFFENRELQHNIAKLHEYLDVVSLMPAIRVRGYEGLVAVPDGLSVNDGYKIKWFGDANDWQVEDVELHTGPNGGIAGVVWFRSLESNKQFKLGPGQLGDADFCIDMMTNPSDYIGTVFKVHSREAHEGRAAKVVETHTDKGIGA